MTAPPSAEELSLLSSELRLLEERTHPAFPHTRATRAATLGVAALAKALHVSRSSIMVTDAQLEEPGPTIRYVNPAFEQLTGYGADEVVGRNPRFLQGPSTDRRVLDRLRGDLLTRGTFEGQTINYRKDGSEFVMSWRISAVRSEDGTAEAYVAVQDDRTEAWLDQIRASETVAALQRTLLAADTDAVDDVDVATRYRPADHHSRVGGDWFDVIHVDGVVHLVVGDVVGHGIPAAADMGRLRFALSCLLRSGLDAGAAMHTLRDALHHEHPHFATVAIATIDRPRRSVEVHTFGHPAVLHVSGGRATALRSADPMLGVDEVAGTRSVHHDLQPGDLLVLFTDGLVETRRTTVVDGTEGLRRHLEQVDLTATPTTIASHLLADSLGTRQPTDDVAVLVARVGTERP